MYACLCFCVHSGEGRGFTNCIFLRDSDSEQIAFGMTGKTCVKLQGKRRDFAAPSVTRKRRDLFDSVSRKKSERSEF